MIIRALSRGIITVVLISAGLIACSGARPLINPSALSQSDSPPAAHSRSTESFIYVVDNEPYSSSKVQIYTDPTGKREGQLTGFEVVYGDCADSRGDIFILNSASPSTIIEYPPGGKTPVRTFHDTGYTPTGCSVDPTTGNLAVTNFYANDYSSGTIAIFSSSNALDRPTVFTDPAIFSPRYCGYDANGNLYLDGYSKSLQILFAELPARATQFTSISLNQAVNEPGNLQWDGTYMAIGDSSTNVIYRFSFSGSTGTEVGSTTLGGVTYGLNQFWIDGSSVVGAAAVDKEVGIWKYPAGGSPVKVINQKQSIPIGVAVSTP